MSGEFIDEVVIILYTLWIGRPSSIWNVRRRSNVKKKKWEMQQMLSFFWLIQVKQKFENHTWDKSWPGDGKPVDI